MGLGSVVKEAKGVCQKKKSQGKTSLEVWDRKHQRGMFEERGQGGKEEERGSAKKNVRGTGEKIDIKQKKAKLSRKGRRGRGVGLADDKQKKQPNGNEGQKIGTRTERERSPRKGVDHAKKKKTKQGGKSVGGPLERGQKWSKNRAERDNQTKEKKGVGKKESQ